MCQHLWLGKLLIRGHCVVNVRQSHLTLLLLNYRCGHNNIRGKFFISAKGID